MVLCYGNQPTNTFYFYLILAFETRSHYMHHMCVCGGQKKVSDPRQLEFRMVLSCRVGAGN